ncbi:type I-C CRISPR-associated endonuclease Cas1c [Mucisphaera calidilacus]|uniref:CRISPR-associated endonuclease Cas1 n=1 Tax=Mucisphaera calidilacus TaxID=2527982 RepID=A0A518C075_9BACT|nr:type I-C CRISPR-associated endonuclease Cas1c [Mucisphaera calidilacus]QDU72622.1 CRISPR-associated protein Cas4/endonuclease Cas1 fusion [Mucisphaera calidilacus]
MKHHLNTLFVQTDGTWLRKEGQNILVCVDDETKLRVPIHTIGGVVCFGRINASTAVLTLCAEAGVAVSFLSGTGRLQARVTGFTPGNVLLRRDQYRAADDDARCLTIAGPMVAAKIANSRTTLMRGIRDHGDAEGRLAAACARMAPNAEAALSAESLDHLRGIEGEAANAYFAVLSNLVTIKSEDREAFIMQGRSKRPPRDRFNCILSFLYAMLGHDARSACEACGLDPAVGFLHRDRPGRPSLALDLMEELRSFLCDRLALSLINRRQLTRKDFEAIEGGAIRFTDQTRRTVLAAYQNRKQETIQHPYLQESTTVGLLIHLQARLLSRVLRGELDTYPAFIWR